MTFRCRNQVGSNFKGADVIEIPGDPNWLDRPVPIPIPFVSLGEEAVRSEENGGER